MYTLPASYRESHDNEPKYFNNMSLLLYRFPIYFRECVHEADQPWFHEGSCPKQ